MKDGIEINKYDSVDYPTYSPDRKSFAFVARSGQKSFVIKDGNEGNKYNIVNSLTYSPDGKSFAFVAEKEGKHLIVKDGNEIGKYFNINSLTFSQDSKSLAYGALKKNGKWIIVKDGNEIDKYDGLCRISNICCNKRLKMLNYKKDGTESDGYYKINPDSLKYFPDGELCSSYKENKNGKWIMQKINNS